MIFNSKKFYFNTFLFIKVFTFKLLLFLYIQFKTYIQLG